MSFTFNPMWLNTMTSVGGGSSCQERPQSFLEDLAIAFCRPTEGSGRHASRAMKSAHEVRQVGKADVERDVGDGPRVIGEQACRSPQPAAHQVLMRGDAEDAGKEPQEMKRADPSNAGGAFEIDRLTGVRIQPKCGLHRAAAIACMRLGRFGLATRDDIDEA